MSGKRIENKKRIKSKDVGRKKLPKLWFGFSFSDSALEIKIN
jgi:hypothetical protein